MLLWSIIKLLGVTILILAAIILLLLVMLLFLPFKYSLEGVYNEEKAAGRFSLSWLHYLICLELTADKDDGVTAIVKLFGKKVYDIFGGSGNDGPGQKALKRPGKAEPVNKDNTQNDANAENSVKTENSANAENSVNAENNAKAGNDVKAENSVKIPNDAKAGMTEKTENTENIESTENTEIISVSASESAEGSSDGKTGTNQGNEGDKKTLGSITDSHAGAEREGKTPDGGADTDTANNIEEEKSDSRLEKIKTKFIDVFTKIKNIYDKLDVYRLKAVRLIELYNDERYQKDINLLKRNIFIAVKELIPRNGSGYVLYGSGDPFSTGQAAEAAVLLYPLYGDYIEFLPDFSAKRTEADINIGGRIRLAMLAVPALRIIFNKRLKTLFVRVKGIVKDKGTNESGLNAA